MINYARISKAISSAPRRVTQLEAGTILLLCVAGAVWAIFLSSHFEFERICRGFDLWFDADGGRTTSNITSRWGKFHERSNLHPLYSLFVALPFDALSGIFRVPTSALVKLYVGTQGALLCATCYLALRAFELGRLEAVLGVVLLNSTAAQIFWVGYPEWSAFGAVSILISVIWVAAPASFRNHATGVTQNLISASMVVTNWPIGIGASLLSDLPKIRWRDAFTQTRDTLALLAALTLVQHKIFPEAGSFLNVWAHVTSGPSTLYEPYQKIFDDLTQFFLQALVAPTPVVFDWASTYPKWAINILSSGRAGVPVTYRTVLILAIWGALLGLGLWSALREQASRAAHWFVLLTIGYLFVLHVLFGYDMFLFTIMFAPLLTIVGLWSFRSRYRWGARALCVALILISATYNYQSFRSTVAIHNSIDLAWLKREGHWATDAVAATDCR